MMIPSSATEVVVSPLCPRRIYSARYQVVATFRCLSPCFHLMASLEPRHLILSLGRFSATEKRVYISWCDRISSALVAVS
jgi:hypothetical protein